VRGYDPLDRYQLTPIVALLPNQACISQPGLRASSVSLNVNMRQLGSVAHAEAKRVAGFLMECGHTQIVVIGRYQALIIRSVSGEPDQRVRRAAFQWLRAQMGVLAEVLSRSIRAEGLIHDGRRVPLLGQLGVVFLLTLASCGGAGQSADGETPPRVADGQFAGDESRARPTPSRTDRLTTRPTLRPTLRVTPSPTATPEPTPVFGEEPTGPVQLATVASVTDGDTIRVLLDGQNVPVRYIGINTPETQDGVQWMGAEAAAANAALVAGQQVVLEKDVSETDRYGRLLRYIWLDTDAGWLLVNAELLRQGYAEVTTYPPDVKYADALFLNAQEEARVAGLGLWGAPPTPVPTPVAITPLVPQPPSNCEPSYPDFCIGIGTGDLDCGDIQWRRFAVRWDVASPDPHRFDGDADGLGCES